MPSELGGKVAREGHKELPSERPLEPVQRPWRMKKCPSPNVMLGRGTENVMSSPEMKNVMECFGRNECHALARLLKCAGHHFSMCAGLSTRCVFQDFDCFFGLGWPRAHRPPPPKTRHPPPAEKNNHPTKNPSGQKLAEQVPGTYSRLETLIKTSRDNYIV